MVVIKKEKNGELSQYKKMQAGSDMLSEPSGESNNCSIQLMFIPLDLQPIPNSKPRH